MTKWLIAVLFLGSIFFDGIVFPALFGFRESFLSIIFILILVLYCEASFQSLIFGVVFSGLAEFYWGFKLGVLILPLLASVGVFFLLNKFFNVKNRFLMIFLGIIMFVVFWEISILVNKVI